jgi:hypothetical protein
MSASRTVEAIKTAIIRPSVGSDDAQRKAVPATEFGGASTCVSVGSVSGLPAGVFPVFPLFPVILGRGTHPWIPLLWRNSLYFSAGPPYRPSLLHVKKWEQWEQVGTKLMTSPRFQADFQWCQC